jgi:uncharacterized protein YjbI with pentapeptide repeats
VQAALTNEEAMVARTKNGTRTRFRWADLSGADMTHGNFTHANFTEAKISGAVTDCPLRAATAL